MLKGLIQSPFSKAIMILIVILAIFLLYFFILDIRNNNPIKPAKQKVVVIPPPGKGEKFTNKDFTTVLDDPSAHIGATVEITGKVFDYFVKPEETQTNKWRFQIWIEPESRNLSSKVKQLRYLISLHPRSNWNPYLAIRQAVF